MCLKLRTLDFIQLKIQQTKRLQLLNLTTQQNSNQQCLIQKHHQIQKRNIQQKYYLPYLRLDNKKRNQLHYKQNEVKLLQNLKQEELKMEEQINLNLKQEQNISNINKNIEKQQKEIRTTTNIENKGQKYQEYGIFQNGAYTCLKCQSRVKRTQDLLKHWTVQHGRQATTRRKRNMINEETQCIKKISQENPKIENLI
ncbi:unnamed protein product [Paramecium primaurelia]|uniref:C2H2-type domain-containing protein n=1 Tax=Paramecium primaurelia TaxID=5886 RepID=A0A8S1K2S4_PARPR|nr:unnamed protein product [Paramecium primaurelia]